MVHAVRVSGVIAELVFGTGVVRLSDLPDCPDIPRLCQPGASFFQPGPPLSGCGVAKGQSGGLLQQMC